MMDLNSISARLSDGHPVGEDDHVVLELDGWHFGIRSNSPAILARLREYFAHVVCEVEEAEVGRWLDVIERDEVDLQPALHRLEARSRQVRAQGYLPRL